VDGSSAEAERPEKGGFIVSEEACPRCGAKTSEVVLFKCIGCFTVYCKACVDTDGGRVCPKCGVSQRMVVSPKK
jgi:ribosomal protein S27AE